MHVFSQQCCFDNWKRSFHNYRSFYITYIIVSRPVLCAEAGLVRLK